MSIVVQDGANSKIGDFIRPASAGGRPADDQAQPIHPRRRIHRKLVDIHYTQSSNDIKLLNRHCLHSWMND